MFLPRFRTALVIVSLSLLSACATASQWFDGAWGYRQSCGYEHTANLVLKQQGSTLTGKWDDGTRITGEDGELRGDVHNDRATVRFCIDGETGRSDNKCPQFGEASDYFVREGDTLVWHRRFGAGYKPYLTLHVEGKGESIAEDKRCDDDASEDDQSPAKETKP